MRRSRLTTTALAAAITIAVAGCGESAPAVPDGPVAIVEIVADVAYYPACANEPVEFDGTTWYPVPEWGNGETAERYAEITAVEREQPVSIRGFAPRVAAPGPGDDIGTLVVWADDIARFESESGLVEWLTTDELTYNWVC